MEHNVNKYLAALELIRFSSKNEKTTENLEQNLQILRKYVKIDENEISINDPNPEWIYCIYLCHIFSLLLSKIDFTSDSKENLLSVRHINCCIEAIKDIGSYGLRPNIHPLFKTHKVFSGGNTQKECNYKQLHFLLEVLHKILQIKIFHSAGSLSVVIRDYMAGIFTIIAGDLLGNNIITQSQKDDLQIKLNSLWDNISKCEYFRNILFLKGAPNLPDQLQSKIHLELMEKLTSSEGFKNLVLTLVPNQRNDNIERPQSDFFEVIANIVGHKAHSMQFHQNMIEQIFKFINLCLTDKSMSEYIGAGLLCLNRLWKLREEYRKSICQKLNDVLKKLTSPSDIIFGLIVMDHSELKFAINFIFMSFCTSSIECLPSEILATYLPLLLKLYNFLPDNYPESAQIRCCIVRCLANRSKEHLQDIVSALIFHNYPSDWKMLHPRIIIVPNESLTDLNIKIGHIDVETEFRISNVLPEILIKSEHNILTYNIFICLLKLMEQVLSDDAADEPKIDLLQTEEELITFLNLKYPIKVEIFLSLSALVVYQPLKCQITENSIEFLRILKSIILSRSRHSCVARENTDHILLLMLSISQEILGNNRHYDECNDLCEVLLTLKKNTENQLILHRINSLIDHLKGGSELKCGNDSKQFYIARDLMKENENHLKVYGINMMIQLLKEHDTDALANGHIIIALAMNSLKEAESYVFLNCVRLFVSLTNVMEAEVLEILSDEYANEKALLDYRLVVGEAILKVTKELGPLSYKYKDVLVNCFLYGCRSNLDEFRWSSYSNLATLCRLLSFQVHNFFQELLDMIENELNTGKYIPAKRAATFVLSELLCGFDNLMDFEEFLLPIYKLLKKIELNESCDEKTRLHATTALRSLNEKCKQLLFPKQKVQKEIIIRGIKEPNTSKKSHILEIN